MRIGLVHIGDELLAGKILNTNTRDAALWLADLGHSVAFSLTIPDGVAPLVALLRENLDGESAVLPRCDMLIMSGGLGPTHDDLTRDGLAEYLETPLEVNAQAKEWLAEFLGIAATDIPEGQGLQTLVPRGVIPLHNPLGTACGLRFTRNDCTVFAFAGVPAEFRALFDAHCLPLLMHRDTRLLRRRALTFGLPESRQRDLLRGFTPPPPFHFSSLPSENGVTLGLEAFVPEAEADAQAARLDAAWEDLLARLPPECVVERNGSPLPETVFRLLRERNATVSSAESCTAGAVGFLLTETPGSSAVFERGFLTYSNAAKGELLGVSQETLETHGAVSEETARAMAQGCRERAGSDYAIAVTGIAGPEGGTPDKPVGLVYIAVSSARNEDCARFQFRGDRNSVRWKSAFSALNLLRLLILKELEKI